MDDPTNYASHRELEGEVRELERENAELRAKLNAVRLVLHGFENASNEEKFRTSKGQLIHEVRAVVG